MKYDELVQTISKLIADLKSWEDFALKTKEKSEDIVKMEIELNNRENIVKKETEIARQRKEVLDAREKNIEVQEARIQRLSQT
jgi:hypothetical protein